ncbi:MAG: CHASE2 domain-containing protein [Gammaproteobacteria bacterium]
MFPSGKQAMGLPGEMAQAAMFMVLAIAFALGGDRLVGIERGFYDLCQRLSASISHSPVVIVKPEDPTGDLWNLPRLDELLADLNAAGAKAILPATPPPPVVGQADLDRLQTLIRLEDRSQTLPNRSEPGLLRRQLAEAELRIARQKQIANAVQTAGNVVLGLATTDRGASRDQDASACASRVAGASERFAAQVHPPAALAALMPTSDALCQAAATVAHVALLTDRDGIVRQAAPVLLTPPGAVPSSALAAIELAKRAASGNSLLARYYRSADGSSGFPVVSSDDVLNGRAAATIKGRYVVVGNPEADAAGGIRTPMHNSVGTAAFIATDLANYLAKDHIARPGWALWVELGMALLLGAAVVFGGRLGIARSAIFAIAGMLLLLVAEYVLVSAAGIWLHFAGLALFCLTGLALLQSFVHLAQLPAGIRPESGSGSNSSPSGPTAELDLGFSVLRQQPTTERTKQQLYALAMEHGKKRDYAKAERVFRHLAARDPGYRDVAAKLEKLSGARGVAVARPSRSPEAAPAASGSAIAAANSEGRSDDKASTQAGHSLGRYELERVIGRGAMATVYLGRDPTINRRVAIKRCRWPKSLPKVTWRLPAHTSCGKQNLPDA